eukprot:PhM_4_TR8176/c0_g1_i1/m.62781/K03858/PIGH, GPI15; phosphatidylinositol glycan, class H
MVVECTRYTSHSVRCVVHHNTSSAITKIALRTLALLVAGAWLQLVPITSGAFFVLCWALYSIANTPKMETLLVSRDVAAEVSGTSLLGRPLYHCFVDMRNLSGLYIQEGYQRHSVKYYLALVHEDDTGKHVDVVFRLAMPRLKDLTTVYRHVQNVLG